MDLPTLDSAHDSQVENRSSSGYTSATPTGERFRTLWILTCGATLALCILVVFRPFWISRGDLILSDPVDGRFSIAILEHWNRVFHGQVPFTSPNFFCPTKGVLGFSEAFFLHGIPFSVLRFAGFDRYLAFEMNAILFTAIGFVSMLCLLRNAFGFHRTSALLGAVLFVGFNTYYIHMTHPQLVCVMLVPTILLLAWHARMCRDLNRTLTVANASGSAVLLALIFLTSFYVGWFTVVFCGVILAVYFGLLLFKGSSKEIYPHLLRLLWVERWTLCLVVAAFVLALAPFLIVYIPALERTGTRLFSDTVYYMPSAWGVFDSGRDNLIWGKLSFYIERLTSPEGMREHAAGWPLLTIAVFLGSGLYSAILFFNHEQKRSDSEERRVSVILAITLACVALCFTGIRIGNDAPGWELLWNVIPGSKAIRVPQRMNLVLSVGIIVVCVFGLEQLVRKLRGQGRWQYVIPVVLACGLIVEQINLIPTHLISRASEAAKFAKVSAPPASCGDFYVSSTDDRRYARLEQQVDAMLMAEQFNVPTINGYSGWFPTGWDLLAGTKRQISEAAREWSEENNLSHLCKLDLGSDMWSVIDVREPADLGELVPNALENPGFENANLRPWLMFQHVQANVTSLTSHSGLHSLAESGGGGSVYQDIRGLEPGRPYTIAAWVSSSPNATATAQIATFAFAAKLPTFSPQIRAESHWQLLSHPVIADSTGAIRVHLFRGEGLGTVYWDDVAIYGQ